MKLKEKISKLPSSPGVYLMKDSLNSIIYVGKSKNLKSRVGSYFQNSKSHSPKVVKLVKNINDFEYILTDTEFEAFILECKLIKEIKPIYNKKMKSPLSYCYIKITMNEKYPNIEICTESNKNDRNIYFGPYTNKNTVERAVQGIRECCKIICSNKSRKATTCLNYSLGLCIGICTGENMSYQYNLIIDKIIKLLKVEDTTILNEMEYRMNASSEKFDFESAAKYRDYISSINYLIRKEKVKEFTEENKNIVMLEYLSNQNSKLFLIKGNKILFSEKYLLTISDSEAVKTAMMKNILLYFNKEASKHSVEISRKEIDEAQIIYSYLKSGNNNCNHIIIAEEWLNVGNTENITKAINELLCSGYSGQA